MADKNKPFDIAGRTVKPGSRVVVEFPLARLPAEASPQMLPCLVAHGKTPGPTVFVSAAIHGDEINGTGVIRRLADDFSVAEMSGTVLMVPVVNHFGFALESRYLPDRRDLNRCFPGSKRGSLGSRIARIFMDEIVERCDAGVDLHSGSNHRTNTPHIRANLDDPKARALAQAFGTPWMMHAKLRPGSLREAGGRKGVPILTFEGGESHRFDRTVIAAAVDGVKGVLAHLSGTAQPENSREIRKSVWLRAKRSGMFWSEVEPGDEVTKGAVVGRITDVLGRVDIPVHAPAPGVVIGLNLHPPVHQGDALLNLGLL
ncbi:MAG: putative deacylase [Myxococcota bacterium]|jgi:predicted deacylase